MSETTETAADKAAPEKPASAMSEIVEIIKTNVRFPDLAMGDFRAQLAAVRASGKGAGLDVRDVPADATVVCDMCIPGYWLGGFLTVSGPRRLSYPLGWGTLGCGFPQEKQGMNLGRRVALLDPHAIGLGLTVSCVPASRSGSSTPRSVITMSTTPAPVSGNLHL